VFATFISNQFNQMLHILLAVNRMSTTEPAVLWL